jgi:hypothetical protein
VPPQAPQMQTASRGPVWGMLVVFLVLVFIGTIKWMPASEGDFYYRLGRGTGAAIAPMLGIAALILLLGGEVVRRGAARHSAHGHPDAPDERHRGHPQSHRA